VPKPPPAPSHDVAPEPHYLPLREEATAAAAFRRCYVTAPPVTVEYAAMKMPPEEGDKPSAAVFAASSPSLIRFSHSRSQPIGRNERGEIFSASLASHAATMF